MSYQAQLTQALAPVADRLPSNFISTLTDLHRAAGAQDLAATLAAGARFAGILATMPTGRTASTPKTSSTAADSPPPEPPRQIPDKRAYANESLWQAAVRTWKLARAKWRSWCEKQEAKRQARLDAEAADFRRQLEAARRGE